MISKRNGLSKLERLHSRKQMDAVFATGKSVRQGPLKLVFIEAPFSATNPTAFMFTVSKRQFKRAHDRNYIKRCIREGLRKNKGVLEEMLILKKQRLAICFVYINREVLPSEKIENKILENLNKIKNDLQK